MVSAAGIMASVRVIRRRSQGRMRKLRKPSITIWPASVPVSVEDWPEQSSATAKITPAMLVPSSGTSSTCACWISVTTIPRLKNTAAASTRMAAFTSSAPFSATTESIRLKRQAVRFSAAVWPMLRVCTSAECRYMLCGITVAPRMVTAR